MSEKRRRWLFWKLVFAKGRERSWIDCQLDIFSSHWYQVNSSFAYLNMQVRKKKHASEISLEFNIITLMGKKLTKNSLTKKNIKLKITVECWCCHDSCWSLNYFLVYIFYWEQIKLRCINNVTTSKYILVNQLLKSILAFKKIWIYTFQNQLCFKVYLQNFPTIYFAPLFSPFSF